MAALAARKVDKEELYISLLKKYPGLTLHDIIVMNDYQQYILNRGSKYLHFETQEELDAWMRQNAARS